MNKTQYETGEAPAITIEECLGDVIVRVGQERNVSVKGNHSAKETEGGLILRGEGSLILSVPTEASLSIAMAQSNVVVKNVLGDIHLGEMMGDTVLSNIGMAKVAIIHGNLLVKNTTDTMSIQTVHGDASLRNVHGDLSLDTVHGNFSARDVNSSVSVNEVYGDMGVLNISDNLTVQRVKGNAKLKAIGGIAAIANVHGDLQLTGGLGEGKHTFTTRGNATLKWPADTPLNLTATGNYIRNRLPLEDVVQDGKTLSGRLGQGDITVTIDAKGDVNLKEADISYGHWDTYGDQQMDFDPNFDFDFNFDFEGIGNRIREEIEGHMARLTGDLEQRFGPDFAQKITERVGREAERAAERAEREAERAAARAERAAERAQRDAERYAAQHARMAFRGGSRFTPPSPPPPPPPPIREVSAEEQLKILRMVESGTISPEEANMLLKALEKA